jgi:hypothetical protein
MSSKARVRLSADSVICSTESSSWQNLVILSYAISLQFRDPWRVSPGSLIRLVPSSPLPASIQAGCRMKALREYNTGESDILVSRADIHI